jgi:hypothetical protein
MILLHRMINAPGQVVPAGQKVAPQTVRRQPA